MEKPKKEKYHNVVLCKDVELSRALKISPPAVTSMSNKKKRFLLKLGLTYKKALDNVVGYEEFKLDEFDKGRTRGNLS